MVLFGEINLFLVRGVLEKDPLKLGRRWKQSWERDLSLIITIRKYIIGKCSNVEYVVNGESLVIRRFLMFKSMKKILGNIERIYFILDAI